MDLIYSNFKDNKIEDIGIIHSYELDVAYGSEENDYELTIPQGKYEIYPNSILYLDGTEYGGIVDSISINSQEQSVTYSGRTFQGILNSFILYPSKNENVLSYAGDIELIINQLLERLNITELFDIDIQANEEDRECQNVSDQDSEGNLYMGLYDYIVKLTYQNGMKPKILVQDGKITISIYSNVDYSDDDYFVLASAPYVATKSYNKTNHYHCRALDEETSKTYDIDVYLDEDGNVLPYSNDNPLQDSDYIFSVPTGAIGGMDSRTEYISTNAEATNNYIRLTEKPKDWNSKYMNYFMLGDDTEEDSEDEYISVEADAYHKLTSQPSDWATNFEDYYTRVVDGLGVATYTNVEGKTTSNSYSLTTQKPTDWGTNFGSYFQKSGSRFVQAKGLDPLYKSQKGKKKPKGFPSRKVKDDDGDGEHLVFQEFYTKNGQGSYEQLKSSTKTVYRKMKSKPSNWNKDHYSDYYYKGYNSQGKTDYIKCNIKYIKVVKKLKRPNSKGETEKVTWQKKERPFSECKWKKNRYYEKESKTIYPSWRPSEYYRDVHYQSPPTWVANKYYQDNGNRYAPTFQAKKIYEFSFPNWQQNKYYYEVVDHYASMIENILSRIEDDATADSLDIDLPSNQIYDINDMVGINDSIIEDVVMRISKKIVKIKNGIAEVSYEIGDVKRKLRR